MITIQDLRKSFQRRAVVQDLSLQAPDGAITGLLGSNGAGKTTTLRMICGALQPDSGTVQIDDAGDPLVRQRRLGALLDHTGLYSRLTLRENLVYFGRLHGLSPESLPARVDGVVSMLGLESIADRRTAGFSQGEHMKTALARALLHGPQNLVLDEPTNGLDVHSIRSLRAVLMRLRDEGKCILFSSHVLEEVRALCDRVFIIAGGRLAASGTPEELCAQTGACSLEEAFVRVTC
jgi:sodium transport system ATP-binding protein